MIRLNNKVVLYARFSSDNQRTESIDAQIRAMKAYCKQRNYIIVDTYIDEAKSATTDRRPAFQQMIADSSNKTFNIVLVHKLDRFARNRYDSAVYKRELKKNGVVVYSVLENLDDSPESIMLEAILEGMSEYYSQNLSREVMKGLKETALQCKHTGGIPPLGYDIDEETRKLIINPYEAETVKLIFDMYGRGCGYTEILDTLRIQNRKTKIGNEFQKNSLSSILNNPKYNGVYVFNRSPIRDSASKRSTKVFKDSEDIIFIEGGCPRIVDDYTYQKVQERLSNHKHIGGRINAKENYLLSGKVYCKDCGRSMVGNRRNSGRSKLRYVTYRCPSHKYECSNKEINKDYLEDYIIHLIEQAILNTSSLNKISSRISRYAREQHNKSKEVKLQIELAEIKEALKNVSDAIASGLISQALIDKLNDLEGQKAVIENKLLSTSNINEDIYVDTKLILSEYNQIKNSPASPEYKRFISGLIDRIDIGRYMVNIRLKTGLDIFDELDTTYDVRRQEIYQCNICS